MIPEEVLHLVLSMLDDSGIAYMITGSFAANVHGLPRATQDADIVIAAEKKPLNNFLDTLGGSFYFSREAANDALRDELMFNIIHLETGFKVDLIVRKGRPFSREEFSRRRKLTLHGSARWFASAEDIILAKLEWSRMGNSERQFSDALNVAKVQGEALDRAYLEKWSEDLGIQEQLMKLFDALGAGP